MMWMATVLFSSCVCMPTVDACMILGSILPCQVKVMWSLKGSLKGCFLSGEYRIGFIAGYKCCQAQAVLKIFTNLFLQKIYDFSQIWWGFEYLSWQVIHEVSFYLFAEVMLWEVLMKFGGLLLRCLISWILDVKCACMWMATVFLN